MVTMDGTRTLVRLLGLALALGACAGGPGPGTDRTDTDTDLGEVPRGAIVGLGIAPAEPVAALGEKVLFSAVAYFESGASQDVTDIVDWTATDDRVVSIGLGGLATALAVGRSDVVAQLPDGGPGAKVKLVVRDAAPLQFVALAPDAVEIAVGQTVRLKATGTWADGEEGDVTGSCAWESSDEGVATVPRAGAIEGIGAGTATVTATCGEVSATAVVTVAAEATDLGLPDLRVTGVAVAVAGDEVTWSATVRNDGDALATDVFIDAFLDLAAAPTPADLFDATAYIPSVPAGGSAPVTIVLEGASAGTFSSWLMVDADGWIAESNETNNASGPHAVTVTSTGPAGPADLVIVDFFAIYDGTTTSYVVEIRNDGGSDAEDFWLDVVYDSLTSPTDCTASDDYVFIPLLAPGETFTWYPEVDDGPFLWWDSWAWVDSCDDVMEDDESNNQDTFEVTP